MSSHNSGRKIEPGGHARRVHMQQRDPSRDKMRNALLHRLCERCEGIFSLESFASIVFSSQSTSFALTQGVGRIHTYINRELPGAFVFVPPELGCYHIRNSVPAYRTNRSQCGACQIMVTPRSSLRFACAVPALIMRHSMFGVD